MEEIAAEPVMRGSLTHVVDTLHPTVVRGSLPHVVDTLQVAETGKQRDKSGRRTSPPTLKGIRRKKRILVVDGVKKVRSSDSVKRVLFSDRGTIQAVEDLSIRPTTVAVSKHAKIAVKRSYVSKESSRTKRRQRRKTQSSPSLAPQAAHVSRIMMIIIYLTEPSFVVLCTTNNVLFHLMHRL